MPVPSQYYTGPLMALALTPFNDNAIRVKDDALSRLIEDALSLVSPGKASSLQCILATILGGYETPPEQPDLDGVDPLSDPQDFAEKLVACEMIAMQSRSREEVAYVREQLRRWEEIMPQLSENDVFTTGAFLLPMLADYYCRCGDKCALLIAENYRAQLPNVGAFLSAFPLQIPFEQEEEPGEYGLRMERFAANPGRTLLLCACLTRFTGSHTAYDAIGKGFDAMVKYHGQPNGCISQQPFVAGKNPCGGASFMGVCEFVTALSEALLLTGDARYADRLNMLLENVLPELIGDSGIRRSVSATQLSQKPCVEPGSEELTALLRMLYSLRRCLCARAADDTVDVVLPRCGEYRFRLNEDVVSITCTLEGFFEQSFRVKVDCENPVKLNLRLRVPYCAGGARLLLNGENPQICPVGQMARISRTFAPGDEITLEMKHSPELSYGYRNACSVHVGPTLMVMPLPEADSEFRYALLEGNDPRPSSYGDKPAVSAKACFLPQWGKKGETIAPPPQGMKAGAERMELLLMPCRDMPGRVAELPIAKA